MLPFGLKNAPAAFQRMISQVLAGLLWVDVFVYIDDIVIGGKTWESHLRNVRAVFERLRAFGLILKPTKCHFFKTRVKVLGFLVSREGTEANPQKIRAVLDFPVPTTVKAVRGFIGLCSYYRRFIQNFAMLATPLHRLAKKDIPFTWGADQR